MAQYQTADGRWIVGNVQGESDYHGFLGWRDCVIQLTASGATADSVNYLNAFRDYAFAHNALGESIMPPSVNVWISNNGTTTAVQADDISVDGNTFSIGGIKWTGSAWDYSNAGQSSGGGGSAGGGVLVVTATLTADGTGTCDKTMGEIWTAAQTMPVILAENLAHVGIIGITQATIKYTDEPSYILRGVNTNYRATSLDDYPSVDSGDEPGGTNP